MSSLVLAKFMTILLVLAHASMLLNSVTKSVSESSGTKRVESSANLINSLLPDRVFKSSAKNDKDFSGVIAFWELGHFLAYPAIPRIIVI